MTKADLPEQMTVTIAKASVQVPIYRDLETTRALAHRVSDRIAQIAQAYGRLDTHAFALRAAFEFATDLEAAKEELADENRELALALEPILAKLRAVITGFAGKEA